MIDVDLALIKDEFHLSAQFTLSGAGVTGIFGQSGGGKTSLLRAIAGLEPDTTGSLSVNGHCWQNESTCIPTEERHIGLVFQEPSLFSHLDVKANLLFASRRSRSREGDHKTSQASVLEDVCTILELHDLLHRDTRGLSGGEQQRVAIGRALMASPVMLMMDEPLSALDHRARRTLMPFLEKTFQELDIPVLYVSHSTEEIARLADNLVLIEQGRVTAYGTLSAVLGAVDSPLHEADEAFSVFNCTVGNHDLPHLTSLISKGGEILQIARVDVSAAEPVKLRIRARDVSLCLQRPQQSSILNILPAQIIDISQQIRRGSRSVKLDIGGETLLARVSEYSVQLLKLAPGQRVFAQIKSAALVV